MAIEKKSLISNRTATKKALITKPEVTKVASTRMGTRAAVRPKVAPRVAPRVSTRLATTRLTSFRLRTE